MFLRISPVVDTLDWIPPRNSVHIHEIICLEILFIQRKQAVLLRLSIITFTFQILVSFS